MQTLRYAFSADDSASVTLRLTQKAWVLDIQQQDKRWLQDRLLPNRHPLDLRSASDAGLQLEADGFTVSITYPVLAFSERHVLTFEHLPMARQGECPVRLKRYRHEQWHATTGVLRSGLVLDFSAAQARFLAIEGQALETPSWPHGLRPQETCLLKMPPLFDWAPALDVRQVR